MFLHEPARCFPQGKPPGLPQESRRRPEKGRSACAAGTMQSSKPDMSQAAFLWGRTGVWGEGQRQRTPIPSISFSSFSSSQLSGGPRSPSRLWPAGVTLLLQTSPLPASLPPCRGARSKRGDFRFRETNNQKIREKRGVLRRQPSTVLFARITQGIPRGCKDPIDLMQGAGWVLPHSIRESNFQG